MNNFNRIFSTIKKYCSTDELIPAKRLDKIEKEAKIINGMSSLFHYLDVLSEMGFIMYSAEERTITLTEKGKSTQKLFGQESNEIDLSNN